MRWRSRSYREKTASELAELGVKIMEYVGDLRNIKFTGVVSGRDLPGDE